MKKVVTLGEIMLRLSPEGRKRFLQADRLDVNYGGSEANVAVALCNMGCPAEFVTALPENDLGRAAENFVRSFGVSTAHCVKKQGRLGVYYLEKGAAQRPSKVIYDREGSVFSKAESADFDFDEIFDGAGWFHFSGITPALSPSAAELTEKAVESAKKKGLTVSCDLNYRSALWSVEKASKTLAPLLYQTDVLIANENHLKMLFGIGEGGNLTCAESAAAAAEKFGLSQSVMTVRRTLSADDNNFSAVLYEKGRHFRSKKYRMHIVDRVGGGDGFAAGLIFGNVKGFSDQDTVEFAAAAGCLKHSVEGDAGIFTEREVLSLAGGLSDGRVQR